MSTFFPQEIIRKKRDGGDLGEDEIAFFVRGLTDGAISEGQVAAFAMAVFFRGMSMGERTALTRAMTASGGVLDWPDAPGPVLDKHSTGGIGDKVSLIVAPVLAACGAAVPMISGRGLGHTGGTLDKLDSIEGYSTAPDLATFRRAVAEAGCAIIGQTAELAPADRRLYAIRDVTATVESVPLITASILSKKLAGGVERLVMDVKFGNGAFAAEFGQATELAESLVAVAGAAGLPTVALLTDMNQALGRTAGNAVEVREAIDHLTGATREPRLHEVASALAAELLVGSELASEPSVARAMIETTLTSGAAAERFGRMVAALGGPADLVERAHTRLPRAAIQRAVPPPRAGLVAAVDARAMGLAVVTLGGGRRRIEDAIDHAVGLTHVLGIGDAAGPDAPLAVVHARSESAAAAAAAAVTAAMTIGEAPVDPGPVVRERIGPRDP